MRCGYESTVDCNDCVLIFCILLKKDRSAFILDVACREAENVLLDQRLFQLGEEAFNTFENALEAPIADNQKLKDLLKEKAPWEK